MKTCTLYTRTLPLSSFRWQSERARYESRCKQCEQARAREAYHARTAAMPPDARAEDARKLHACADGWRYPTGPASLAWRV